MTTPTNRCSFIGIGTFRPRGRNMVWERLEIDDQAELEAMMTATTTVAQETVLLVALSTMVPQYQALYSHAKELSKFLLGQLDFKKVATMYSSTLPPEVVIEGSGLMRMHSNQFYTYPGIRRVVMLAGDGSPFDDQQEYAHSVLSFARLWGPRRSYPSARGGRSPRAPPAVP